MPGPESGVDADALFGIRRVPVTAPLPGFDDGWVVVEKVYASRVFVVNDLSAPENALLLQGLQHPAYGHTPEARQLGNPRDTARELVLELADLFASYSWNLPRDAPLGYVDHLPAKRRLGIGHNRSDETSFVAAFGFYRNTAPRDRGELGSELPLSLVVHLRLAVAREGFVPVDLLGIETRIWDVDVDEIVNKLGLAHRDGPPKKNFSTSGFGASSG